MRLFDAEAVVPADRVDLLYDAFASQAYASEVDLDQDAGDGLRAVVDWWELGSAGVLRTASSGFSVARTRRLIAKDPAATVSVAIVTRSRLEYRGEHTVVGTDDVTVLDSANEQRFWQQGGEAYAFQVDRDRLGLPFDVIDDGSRQLRRSPLLPLFHRHLRDVFDRAGELAADPYVAASVGDATTDLLRALLVSAADPFRGSRDVLGDTFVVRALAYAREHLRDPDLTVASLAAATGVSPRYAYQRFSAAGLSLEQWVIAQRLEGAKQALASPLHRRTTVAAIAQAWGFASPSHFSRRFHAAYGLAPGQWRRAQQAAA